MKSPIYTPRGIPVSTRIKAGLFYTIFGIICIGGVALIYMGFKWLANG